jgi:hypothetical protein
MRKNGNKSSATIDRPPLSSQALGGIRLLIPRLRVDVVELRRSLVAETVLFLIRGATVPSPALATGTDMQSGPELT